MIDRLKNINVLFTEEGKRYYEPLRYPSIPISENDIYVITTIGDRLDSLAYQFYNDIRLWWVISTANPGVIRKDSFLLKPGLEVRIPSNISLILEEYDNLNK